MAQYLVVQTDDVRSTRIEVVNGMNMEVDEVTPGVQVYQIVKNDGAVEYRTMTGHLYEMTGGSRVVDATPAAPMWAEVDTTVAPSDEVQSNVITKLEYMNRFQDQELAALYTAAKSVVQVEIWLEKFKVADFIDLADPRTAAGVRALEAAGIIGVGRANEILQ